MNSIGLVYDGCWNIYYGSPEIIKQFIIKITDKSAFAKTYDSEERMQKQLEYYKQEFENYKIHKIEDIQQEIA